MPFFFTSIISQQGKHGRSDSTKRDGCNDCEVNTKAENASSVECEKCAAGTLSEAGSAECRSCEAGMYSNEVGVTAVCVGCESGKYRQSKESNGEGGFTEKTTDSTICVDCPAGWSSVEGSTKCLSCEAGMYSNEVGVACDNCGIGKYRQSKESDGTDGLFTDKITDPTKCVDCPTGWSSAKGSTKCQACGAGTYGDGCKSCPLGYARNGTDHDAMQCRLCKLGETTTYVGAASCEGW